MKTSTIITILLGCILSFFTTLYFAKPRIIYRPAIPEIIQVQHGGPPDHVEQVAPGDALPAAITEIIDDTLWDEPVIRSTKTFREELVGQSGTTYATITDSISVFARCEVIDIENYIQITPFREAIIDEYRNNNPCRSNIWKGIVIGSGVTIGVGTIIYMVVK